MLVSVTAASVNFPDVLIIENKYQTKPPLPFSPGCEAPASSRTSGREVAQFKRGDRVMAVTGYGAFAEEIVVPASRVVPIPDGMDDVTAGRFCSRTARPTTRCATGVNCGPARRCSCLERRAASVSPRSKSARRWARE